MSEYELQRHKKNMQAEFSKNALKPGDKGFIYDKRVDFASLAKEEENSWDEG